MFPFCAPSAGGGDEAILRPFGEAVVFAAEVDKASAAMNLSVEFPELPAPVAVSTAEGRIAANYHLDRVEILPFVRAAAKKEKAPEKGGAEGAKLLWGKKFKGAAAPIASLTPESGRTVVSGQVFGREIREVRGDGASSPST